MRSLIAGISRIVAAGVMSRAARRRALLVPQPHQQGEHAEADCGPLPTSCEIYELECVRCMRPSKFVFETPKLRNRVVLSGMSHVLGHARDAGDRSEATSGLEDWFRGCPVCFPARETAGELLFLGLDRIDLVLCTCGWAGSVGDCTSQFQLATSHVP